MDLRQCGSVLVACLVWATLAVSAVSIWPGSPRTGTTVESNVADELTDSAAEDASIPAKGIANIGLMRRGLAQPFSPSTSY